jgi:1,4-dihydroxy-2-naphthoyl-CoA hydrolase
MRVDGQIEFYVIEQTPERVISEMPIQPGIINPFGVVHAGAILWFADVTATFLAMGSAEASVGMAGFPLAITLNANFTSNQKEGTLKAIASLVKKGRTISIVRTTVLGENDRLIADVTTNHLPAK